MLFVLDQNILLYILLFVGALAIVSLIWAIRLELKLRKFTIGKDGKSLESSFTALKESNEETVRFEEDMSAYLKGVEERLKKSVQGVGTIRFNPFAENSGNQSFATAFVNEHGDGVIFSSLYARERTSVFAKPLNKFQSEYELTKEEKEALKHAQANIRASHNA